MIDRDYLILVFVGASVGFNYYMGYDLLAIICAFAAGFVLSSMLS